MSENKRQKVKKQHYVPRCYLEQWAKPDTYQVYVYDLKTNKPRISSIYDVASENYFYDFDFSSILRNADFDMMGFANEALEHFDDEQYIEHFFAEHIESNYASSLHQIISKARQMSPWELRNCFFISERAKKNFSFHLAWQFIRVKAVRNSISNSADCLEQALIEMGASPEVIKKYSVPNSQLPYIHGGMILNKGEINEMAQSFFRLTWILQVNRTNQPFFTSDNPIGTEAHVHHPFISMSGIQSQGIEVYFPLSPDLMLLMFDGEYHNDFQDYDRRVIELSNTDVVKYCNSRCAMHSERCVFSTNDDFSVIQEMLDRNPNMFNGPHTIMQWNGKTYTPRNT